MIGCGVRLALETYSIRYTGVVVGVRVWSVSRKSRKSYSTPRYGLYIVQGTDAWVPPGEGSRSGLNLGFPDPWRSVECGVSGSRQTALMMVSMLSKAEAHSSSSNLTALHDHSVPSRSRDGKAVVHE